MKKAAFLLLLIAGQVAAQPTPQQEPERKGAPSEPRLNLRLDESDLRALSRNSSLPPAASEEKSSDGLPTLGGDARKFEPATPTTDTRRPYPVDSQMISR
jgi:hypothetical protein